MQAVTTRRRRCRLCSGDQLRLVLLMKPSPIGDAFVTAERKNDPQPLIPLDLYQCGDCGHVQNLDVVDPDLLFRDYLFTTASSAGLVEHFRRYAEEITERFALPGGSLVVEIGSNDGTLLRYFGAKGLRVIGIDPAQEIARQATESGIATIPEFFTSTLAKQIRSEHGPAKLILANNVFAHTDALGDVTEGVRSLLDGDGIFVIEVSYLLDIIDKFLFDTVYHEHLSYQSVRPLHRFFAAHGLHLFDVHRIGSKGGSLRTFVQATDGPHPEQPIVQEMIADEERRGLHQPRIFQEFEQQILERKRAVLELISRAKNEGKRIAGYGASPTTTTLIYQFELSDTLEFIIDDNVQKQGLYSPGRHLEVRPSSSLYEEHAPDIVIVLAWQYAAPITSKHGRYVESGGQFVIPLPELRSIRSAQTA